MVGRARFRPDVVRPARPAFWPSVVCTVLLLLPATAWAGTYFWARTSAGQTLLVPTLLGGLRDGVITTGLVSWGPDPRAVELWDVVIRDRADEPSITAGWAAAELDLGALLGGAGVRLHRIHADDFLVRLGWDAEGTFNLKDAFKRPRPPDAPKKPRRPPPVVSLTDITLRRGRVELTWPTWGLEFQSVDARGEVLLGGEDPLVIHADLQGGPARAEVTARDAAARFAAVEIGAFVWERGGFRTSRLRLGGLGGEREVVLAGGMGFADEVTMEVSGRLDVGVDEVGALATPWLPGGGTVEGLVATLAKGTWSAKAARATAPVLAAGLVRLEGLSLPFDVELTPGGLLPRGHVSTRDARAALVEGPDGVRAVAVVLATVEATIGTLADVRLDGITAESLSLREGAVGAARLAGKARVGLAGGELEGRLETDQGAVSAAGRIEVSILRQRGELALQTKLFGVGGALARALARAVPDEVRQTLGEPVSGSAAFAGQVAPGPKGGPWEVGLELTEAELTGARTWSFEAGRWAGPEPVAAAP